MVFFNYLYMNESKLLSQISVQLSHIFNCRQNGKKNLKCKGLLAYALLKRYNVYGHVASCIVTISSKMNHESVH